MRFAALNASYISQSHIPAFRTAVGGQGCAGGAGDFAGGGLSVTTS